MLGRGVHTFYEDAMKKRAEKKEAKKRRIKTDMDLYGTYPESLCTGHSRSSHRLGVDDGKARQHQQKQKRKSLRRTLHHGRRKSREENDHGDEHSTHHHHQHQHQHRRHHGEYAPAHPQTLGRDQDIRYPQPLVHPDYDLRQSSQRRAREISLGISNEGRACAQARADRSLRYNQRMMDIGLAVSMVRARRNMMGFIQIDDMLEVEVPPAYNAAEPRLPSYHEHRNAHVPPLQLA